MNTDKRLVILGVPGRRVILFLSGVLVFYALYLVSRTNYLLFHSLTEIFSIAVACAIFLLFWNSRRFLDDGYYLFIGIASLFVGGVDLLHTLAYKGMGVFPGYDANLPTQLWIAARYIQSLSFLAAPLFLRRRLRPGPVLVAYALVVCLLLVSVFYLGIFPDCYIEGAGLTPFKKISEYIISLFLAASIGLLFRRRRELDPGVFRLLVALVVATIASELAFTFYISVYGLSNLIGHLLKIVAFYLIYRAFVEVGLTKPYALIFRDLKQSEEALEKSEKRYRALVENAAEGVFVIQDGAVRYANPKGLEMLGRSEDDVIDRSGLEFVHPEDRQKLGEIHARGMNSEGAPCEYEYRILDQAGKINWLSANTVAIEWEERPAALTLVTDITERKQMEEALRDSYEKYRSVVDSANVGLVVIQDGQQVFNNSQMHEMLGYTEEEYNRIDFISLVYPEDRSYALDRIRQRLAGVPVAPDVVEMRALSKSGDVRWIETNSVVIQWEGRPAIQAFVTDITDRKQAEEALRESEEGHRTLFETMIQGVVYQAADGQIISANPAAERILGLTLDQMQGRTSVDPRWRAIHEDGSDFPGETRPAMVALKTGKEVRSVVMGVLDPSQETYTWTNINAVPQFKPGEDEPYQVYTTFEDITERKCAEEALRESEERFRSTLESMEDLVFVLDRDGVFLDYHNPSDTPDLYLAPEVFLGKSVGDTMPRHVAELFQKALDEITATNQVQTFDYSLTVADSERWFRAQTSTRRDTEGRFAGVTVVIRNITEQVRAEEQIRAALQEKEVLLQEIHHRVKNNLQLISSLLDLQSKAIEDSSALRVLQESRNRVRSMALVHERLHESQDLTEIDLNNLVQGLTSHLFRIYAPLAGDVFLNVQIGDLSLDISAAIPCALIINELVSNSLKYGFPPGRGRPGGERGEIRVEMRQEADARTMLVVGDNGIGLPPDLDWQDPPSLGLRLVKLLTEQLRGTIELDNSAGIVFKITFAHTG